MSFQTEIGKHSYSKGFFHYFYIKEEIKFNFETYRRKWGYGRSSAQGNEPS